MKIDTQSGKNFCLVNVVKKNSEDNDLEHLFFYCLALLKSSKFSDAIEYAQKHEFISMNGDLTVAGFELSKLAQLRNMSENVSERQNAYHMIQMIHENNTFT